VFVDHLFVRLKLLPKAEYTETLLWERLKPLPPLQVIALSGVRRKFSWGVHSVAYGGHLHLVCALCDVTIWSHIHVFKRSLL